MATLSVCLVTKNEAHNIVRCLSAVSWADEIIVIDSESTDNTVELCKQFTDKILITPWPGCGPQKKRVFDMATCDWVLMLDADEFVTPKLASEIRDILRIETTYSGFKIPFQSYFCGKQIKYGDWKNERHLRLLKRKQSSIIPRLVHFGVEVHGTVGKLSGYIEHFSFPNLSVVINKMNSYSTDGARQLYAENKATNFWSGLGHGLFAFIRGYFFKFGFLDGRYGFVLAMANAQGSFYKYLKLLELHGQTNNKIVAQAKIDQPPAE